MIGDAHMADKRVKHDDEPPIDCNGDHDWHVVNYDPSVGLFGNLECRRCGEEKEWDGTDANDYEDHVI